jgi:hypothetical protein
MKSASSSLIVAPWYRRAGRTRVAESVSAKIYLEPRGISSIHIAVACKIPIARIDGTAGSGNGITAKIYFKNCCI